jgi:hypothetical protein
MEESEMIENDDDYVIREDERIAITTLFETAQSCDNQLMEWLSALDISPSHDCCNITYQEKIICDDPFKLCFNTKVLAISEHTRIQNRGSKNAKVREAWKKARKFRITGSRCYSVYTYSKLDWGKKACTFFWPTPYTNDNMLHGIKYEDLARKIYHNQNRHVTIIQTGLIVHKKNPFLGYSPDGIIFENGIATTLLEIKCIVKGEIDF